MDLRKKTNILIAVLILFDILFASLLFWSYTHKSVDVKEESNKYPLIDPARSFVDQANFFSTIEPLRTTMKDIVNKYQKDGTRVGVYFEYLNTGANISINQDQRFWPASLSKMPTALAVMKKVEKGDWKLSNELVLFAEDRNNGFGDLYKKAIGTRFTIDELLRALIINSDDTAHRILIRNLEGSDFDEMLAALGMENLYDKNYNITAKEYSRIFRALYNSSFLTRENSTYLLNLLSETQFDDLLKSGIPNDIIFAHKIGIHDPEGTYLDSGIVYVPNRPYLITVMVDSKKTGGKNTAKEIMKELSKAAYEYVKSK